MSDRPADSPSMFVDGQRVEPTRWVLDLTHRVPSFETWQSVHPRDVAFEATFEATFEVDRETYDRLVGTAPTYTVEIETDHNPWHRETSGARARLRKLRDGVWWTFQRRVLRRDLVECTKVTVPNCQVTSR